MSNRIIAAGLAVLAAASLAACSAPANATSAPTVSQAPTTATLQPPATPSSEPTATPARSAGPGSLRSEPGEDVYDFNIRRMFWALVAKDGETAAKYESEALGKWHSQIGYYAPNGRMNTTCTLGTRIPATPQREAAMADILHKEAMSVPGVKTFAYPLTCPNGPNTYIIVAAVNPSLHVEEVNYMAARNEPVFGVPDLDTSPR